MDMHGTGVYIFLNAPWVLDSIPLEKRSLGSRSSGDLISVQK
jgi:hypothetical protein